MILAFVFSGIRDRFILINSETISDYISMTSIKVLLQIVVIIEMMCTYFWFPWIYIRSIVRFFCRRQNERWSSMDDVVFSSSCSFKDISRLSYPMNVFIFVDLTICLAVSCYDDKLFRDNTFFFDLWSFKKIRESRSHISTSWYNYDFEFFSIMKITRESINNTNECFWIDRYVSSYDWDFDVRKRHEIKSEIEFDWRYLVSINVFARNVKSFIHDVQRITFQISFFDTDTWTSIL